DESLDRDAVPGTAGVPPACSFLRCERGAGGRSAVPGGRRAGSPKMRPLLENRVFDVVMARQAFRFWKAALNLANGMNDQGCTPNVQMRGALPGQMHFRAAPGGYRGTRTFF